METHTEIAEQNTERLIQAGNQTDPAAPEFAAKLESALVAEARSLAKAATQTPPPRKWGHAALVVGVLAACVLIALALWAYPWRNDPQQGPDIAKKPVNVDNPKKPDVGKKPIELDAPKPEVALAKWTDDVRAGMMPRIRLDAPALTVLREGQSLQTKAGQRRLVQLADGTRLYVNEKSEVEAKGNRQLTLNKGQIYLEVAPVEGAAKFVVKAGDREMTATGTHFAVQADPVAPGVLVTQGKVAVKSIDQEIVAGQQVAPGSVKVIDAPRASHTLEWTRELMAAAETPMVPACQHAGGALVALDPQGQELKLALRKYHIDVHIEDGFARTTIDQTYFNATWERLEGTFYFPLPADASLSRLAMYVADANNQCKLMEGGMAERQHAANVYETIRYQRRDPALLEWLDGSTFKMRVFPLEAKQEKRIILSYVQKLPSLYGATRYRFAGGLNMPVVRDWSFTARIKNGAGLNVWSPTHEEMQIFPMQQDKFSQHFATNVKPAADVALELHDKNALVDKELPRFATYLFEGQQYLMLRYRPTLTVSPDRQRRDWIVLFEASAARDPLLAGTQVDVLKNLLKNAEYDDTFTLLAVNSKVHVFSDKPQPARPKNVEAAVKFLNETHLIGALDLEQGLQAALKFAKDAKNPHLVHIGSGIPATGQRDAGQLAKMLPESVRYVGVGVGKRWNRAFMKQAAERTGGMFTQINPDEVIAWRAFDLLATLNTPRLLDVQVVDPLSKSAFLMETSMLSQGEEICAMTRIATNQAGMPVKVVVKGMLDRKPFLKEFAVQDVIPGAGYLPRAWAKLEIDRLLADNALKHKDAIIALSKAMYVMSPYTSLLVLETDADYERFKVDKGRKDHWAMYDCPAKIPLVYEPEGKTPLKVEVRKEGAKPTVTQVLGTIVNALYVPDGGTVRHGGFAYEPISKELGGLREVRPTEGGRIEINEMIGIREGERTALSPLLPSPAGFGRGTSAGIDVFGRPAQDMADPGGASSGISEKRKLKQLAETWGRLPPRDQLRGLQEMTNGMSPRQREAIENYFRALNGRAGIAGASSKKDKELADVARLMSNLEDRLETARGSKEPFKEENRLRQIIERLDRLAPSGKKVQEAGYDQLIAERQLIDSENLRQMGDEYRRFWMNDQPSHLTPYRIHGGVGPASSEAIGFDQPQAYVGQVLIVGDAVKKDRVIRRMLGNSSSFGTILNYENIGIELGLQSPVILGRSRVKAKAGDSELSLLYERPKFDYDRTMFTDLLEYAPGLHTTSADILATLEAEADIAAPKLGSIDAGARKLIDKARAAGWQELTIPADGPIPGFTIRHDGAGQFAYERMLPSGLRENVSCDGKTLWHLYPEIGLAGKRPFSRHHHGLVASFHPAFVPSADELARGYDVKALSASTVALTPLHSVLSAEYAVLHLIFAADGSLSERRIVAMPSGKTQLRQLFSADGTIEWKNAEDKSLAKQTRKIAPCKAPALESDMRELVVMTLPIRSQAVHLEQARKRGVDADKDHEAVVERFISACVAGDPYFDKGATMGRLFHTGKDRRPGFFTLLNAAGANVANQQLRAPDGTTFTVAFDKDHPGNPLALFLAQCQHEIANNDPSAYPAVAGPKDGFIQRLATFRNVWRSWHHQRPTMNGSADMPVELAKVIAFLETTPSPMFAYAVLDAMQRRCNRPPTDHMLDIAVKRFGPIASPLGLGYVLRYEQARALYQAGKGADAAKAFKELHADTLKYGVLPPIDTTFREVANSWGDAKFVGFTRRTADDVLAKKRYGLAFQLAHQVEQLGDVALRDDILSKILAGASAEERYGLTVLCVRYFAERKSFVQAERLLAKLLEDKKMAEYPELWRWREEIARSFGQSATAIAAMEKALDLEYAELPELVNLESIRTDYRALMQQYQRIAEALEAVGHVSNVPDARTDSEHVGNVPHRKAFLAKVIRTADRWRLIDADSSEPCMLAGKIMHTLGEKEWAWDYWTTPIDLHPAESKPWLDLAETLKAEGDLERADKAFGLAFEAEATNPDILWQRAQNQVHMGQPDTARKLYRQIADGTWQGRFAATVERAKGLADK